MAFATETDLRYPVGKWDRPHTFTDEQRLAFINQIEKLPPKCAPLSQD